MTQGLASGFESGDIHSCGSASFGGAHPLQLQRQTIMIRRTKMALALALALGVAACDRGGVTGNPITGDGTSRTLSSMLPEIKASLTPTLAEQVFGFPDQRTLVPPIILTYNVENSSKVSLGFPDISSKIQTATLTDKSGTVTTLPILP